MATDKKNKQVSRRGFLGAGLLLPFLSNAQPFGGSKNLEVEDDEFVTMLTSKGKTVKVRKSALENAKVIERKMSNQSLLNWLKLRDHGKQ